MRHPARLYAQALTSLLEKGVSKNKEEEMAQNLLALLKKNGDSKKLSEIIHLAEKILVTRDGGREVVIETAHPIPDLKKKLHKLLTAHDIVEERINPMILAGVRVTVNGETQIDASLRSELDKLFASHSTQ